MLVAILLVEAVEVEEKNSGRWILGYFGMTGWGYLGSVIIVSFQIAADMVIGYIQSQRYRRERGIKVREKGERGRD